MHVKNFIALCLTMMLTSPMAHAGVLSEMLKAAGRVTLTNGATEVAEQGVRSAATQATRQLASEAAEVNARRLAARSIVGLGDDVARASSSGIGSTLRLADDVAEATGRLSPQSSRRLMMMSDSIEATGQASQLIALLARDAAADQVVDFLWRNKGAIAGGTLLTLVIANPEAVIAGGAQVTESMINALGENIAKPSIDGTLRHVVAPATGGTVVGVVLLFGTCILAVAAIFSIWRKTYKFRRIASFGAFLAKPKF